MVIDKALALKVGKVLITVGAAVLPIVQQNLSMSDKVAKEVARQLATKVRGS